MARTPWQRVRLLWLRLVNPSEAFVQDVYDGVPDEITPEVEAEARRRLEAMGYDTSQLPALADAGDILEAASAELVDGAIAATPDTPASEKN